MSHPMELRIILSDLIFYNFRGSLFYFYLVRFVSSFFYFYLIRFACSLLSTTPDSSKMSYTEDIRRTME